MPTYDANEMFDKSVQTDICRYVSLSPNQPLPRSEEHWSYITEVTDVNTHTVEVS